ncbi:MAG TPA: hypothetical protein VEJ36_01440 [Nitrososphaerales archaeon]|nr:hypothetical protein [Nitrososphaerales archaeon]
MSAIPQERAELESLVRTPYINVLTYPKISLRSANLRIKQLKSLGVRALLFEGRTKVGRLGLLGLGTVSVVVSAETEGGVLALKIRRTDANRPSMDEEWRLASLANRVGVGPQVVSHSRDFMLMKRLDYVELYEWFKGLKGPGTRAAAREMVHRVLNQCRKLDIIGLDHGQLSNLRKHVVVADGLPWIIDFESSATTRRPKNVTAAAQNLFIGGRMSALVRRLTGVREPEMMRALLSEYKKDESDICYARILEALGIQAG